MGELKRDDASQVLKDAREVLYSAYRRASCVATDRRLLRW